MLHQIVAPEMPDIDHAGFHRGVGKSRESNMCHFPASTILLLTLCQWFRTLYNTQKAIQENQDATIDAFAVICGPIIPTGRLWLLQDIMPQPAGSGSCRISHRFPSVHRKTVPTDRAWPVPVRMQALHMPDSYEDIWMSHSALYAGLTGPSGIRHELVPVGIMSVLYTTIEQAASTTHSEMATIAVQTSERAKRGMQKKGKSTP